METKGQAMNDLKPLTREDILRNLPNASETIVKSLIGQIGEPAGLNVKRSTVMADNFEQMQRRFTGERGGVREDREDAAILLARANEPTVPMEEVLKSIPSNARAGQWCEVGGQRFYSRSHWERNYAAYLEFLKLHGWIRSWKYEPKTFWFEGIKRGVCSYKPDFHVILADGTEEYREVKGWLDPKSKTKLKRMKKYFPEVKVRVIDGAWFKRHGPAMAILVPGWRKKGKK